MKQITGEKLKIAACASMVIDHIGAVIIEKTMPLSDLAESLSIAFRLFGRMAFPIFCFLLAEGARHTSDKRRYILRLIAFALISEIPYDVAMSGNAMSWTKQNVFFTLALGLLTIYTCEWVTRRLKKKVGKVLIAVLLALGTGTFNQIIIRGSYGMFGIAAIVLVYFIPEKNDAFLGECVALSIMDITEVTALLVYPLIRLYTGERGVRCSKWLFYWFYPIHLLILYGISYMCK